MNDAQRQRGERLTSAPRDHRPCGRKRDALLAACTCDFFARMRVPTTPESWRPETPCLDPWTNQCDAKTVGRSMIRHQRPARGRSGHRMAQNPVNAAVSEHKPTPAAIRPVGDRGNWLAIRRSIIVALRPATPAITTVDRPGATRATDGLTRKRRRRCRDQERATLPAVRQGGYRGTTRLRGVIRPGPRPIRDDDGYRRIVAKSSLADLAGDAGSLLGSSGNPLHRQAASTSSDATDQAAQSVPGTVA